LINLGQRDEPFTNCQEIDAVDITTTPAQREKLGNLQYLISAKTTMHNFDGDAQNGTCVLVADWPDPAAFPSTRTVIIDKTTVKMGETVHNADQQSIALQGAFIDPGFSPLRFFVACTTYNGEALETVLTAIPFQASHPFTCPVGPNNLPGEPCTPKNTD
jgi:hypothetical protein